MKNYNKIREYRIKNNLSQEELGNLLGVKKSTISKYESGAIQIKENAMKKLSEIFRVSPSEFMLWSDIDKNADLTNLHCEIKLLENVQNIYGKESIELLEMLKLMTPKEKILLVDFIKRAIAIKSNNLQ